MYVYLYIYGIVVIILFGKPSHVILSILNRPNYLKNFSFLSRENKSLRYSSPIDTNQRHFLIKRYLIVLTLRRLSKKLN